MEPFFEAALLQVALSESHLGKALEEATNLREEITHLRDTTKEIPTLRHEQLELNKKPTHRLEQFDNP